ncbi:MAG: GlxA family transcriptional regulator [Dongiaceae bacterium]
MSRASDAGPVRVGFFLIPDFPMLAFSAAIEALRVANWVSGRTLYEWTLLSEDGGPVSPSCGIPVTPHGAMTSVDRFPIMLVCAGIGGNRYRNKRVFAWLRRLARNRSVLGGVGTGAYALARAGLLDGYRCTIHWEELENFAREFPHLEVTADLIEADRDRLTCPGGTASLDLIFHIVQQQHGRDLAWQIADEFIQHRVRSPNDPQRLSLEARTRINDARLLAAVAAMEKNLEDPLSLEQICTASGLSLRHLQRRFIEVLGKPPTEFYRELRLQRARKMLMHGSKSILDVAVANGFVSGAHFSRCYRAQFGRTPREERRG